MLKTIIVIYLIGFVISGLISLPLYSNDKFYQFQLEAAKKDLEDFNIYLSQDDLTEYMIKDIKLTMFSSYFGVFSIITSWVYYIKNKK